MTALRADIVVPTVGRPSLEGLVRALAGGTEPPPGRVILVDDRGDGLPVPPELSGRVEVLRGPGRGPAAARNAGWRASDADWVAFLDDDVLPAADWSAALRADLAAADPDVAGVQGRLEVPLPAGRRPTDWERDVAGLARSRWATADMAYRRAALCELGGFDERFRRAYREDAELALRALGAGWRLRRGERRCAHPVGPAGFWVSVARQAGNADDPLVRALHGPAWRALAGVPAGRRPRHLATAGAGLVAAGALAAGARRAAAAAAAAWLTGSAELAWARVAPGPRAAGEVARMLATSVAIPFAASGWWLVGLVRARGARPLGAPRPAAVLLDRDGTLIHDVPYNGDPDRVVPIAGAGAALARLRAAGIPVAAVSNQSGVARGLLSSAQVAAVNRRVEELVGPLAHWAVCEHAPEDGCSCRKPAPGLIVEAADRLGVPPARCAVVGDIGADVDAARAVGARAVLVPTPATRVEEVRAADEVAPTLEAAVDLLLEEGR
jgi:histidinol-phosphate phosphatase family protein